MKIMSEIKRAIQTRKGARKEKSNTDQENGASKDKENGINEEKGRRGNG